MKKLLIFVFASFTLPLLSQNIGINTTGATPNASAILDIDASPGNNLGLLIPRVTAAQKAAMNPLPTAAQGLVIYQTNGVEGFYYNTSTTTVPTWVYLSPSTSGWSVTGNGGTNAGTNFLGTTDAVDLAIKTNNADAIRILTNGNVGIGNIAPQNLLTIGPNPTAAVNGNELLQLAKTGDAYMVVRDGTGTGILGSFSGLPFVGSQSNTDFAIRTNNTSKVWVQSGGNVGIGISTPGQKLSVYGNTSYGQIQTISTAVGAESDIGFNDGTSNTWLVGQNIGVNSGTNKFSVFSQTAGINFMTIQTNGNVGIGTTSPTQKLHISGGSVLTDRAFAASTVSIAANTAAFNTGANATTQVRITDNASATANGALSYGATAIEGQYLWITNADAQSVTFSGNAIPSGNTIGFVYVNGAWLDISAYDANGTNWNILGNTGTIDTTNFIGTKDAHVLRFKVNNQKAGYIDHSTFIANTSFGYQTLNGITGGANNTALGFQALLTNTTGSNNTGVGFQSLWVNGTGSNNTAIGYKTLRLNTGSDNIAVGYQTLYQNTGNQNTGIGSGALGNNFGGSYNVAVGYYALNGFNTTSNATNNVALGTQAGYYNNSGTNNVFIGNKSGYFNSSGHSNLFFGNNSGYNNTTGYDNLFMGDSTGYLTSSGYNNIFLGNSAGFTNLNGYENIFLGDNAGYYNTGGYDNIFLGFWSGVHNISGNQNSFIGAYAGLSNTTGAQNVALGSSAGRNNLIGSGNTFLGLNAGYNNISGMSNTCIGSGSGWVNQSGFNNLSIGGHSDFGANNLTNASAIGPDARVDASNCMVLGAIYGINNAPASTFVGIGNTIPQNLLTVGPNPTNALNANELLQLAKTGDAYMVVRDGASTALLGVTAGLPYVGAQSNDDFTFRTNNTERVRITATGRVGIGTTAPVAPLDVNVSTGTAGANYAFYTYNGTAFTGVWAGANSGISIHSLGRITATEFDAYSDVRIKHIIGRSNNSDDLSTLMKLKVTNYKFIDSIGKGNKIMKKVIAQEVEEIYPNAVNKLTDVVPDIYKRAEICNGKIMLPNDLKECDKVKLIFESHTELVEVEKADANSFEVNLKDEGPVFVFGKEVNDFRTVDYEALSSLNISATQQLAKENEILKIQIAELNKTTFDQNQNILQLTEQVKAIQTVLNNNSWLQKPANTNTTMTENKSNNQ